MSNAIIVPGRPDKSEHYDSKKPSNSESHWYSWLKRQLILRDIHAVTIEPPFPFRPRYDEWKKEFERFDIEPDSVLVGHSCGGGFLVRWLSENKDRKVGKVVLVAPWLNPESNPASDAEDFFNFEIDQELASRTTGLALFNSDNDQETISKSVQIIRDKIKDVYYRGFYGYGHFCLNDDPAFNMPNTEFTELLEEILK